VRKLVATAVCLLAFAANGQTVVPFSPGMLIPTPTGVVLTLGTWIYDGIAKDKVYYIEVAGDGVTPEQARSNGFRLAVEQAVGSLISSETTVANQRITRDEIISYAAGFVDRYEIVSTAPGPVGVRMTMKVWVKKSALANRLFNESKKAAEVDGDRASVQLATRQYERGTGDQLLNTVLADYPSRAFKFTIDRTRVVMDTQRSGILQIPFLLKWSPEYVDSLWTALAATQHARPYYFEVLVPSRSWFGFGGQVGYQDEYRYNLLFRKFFNTNPPVVLIELKDPDQRTVFAECQSAPQLAGGAVRTGPNAVAGTNRGIVINDEFRLYTQADIAVTPELLARVATVVLTVVNYDKCPNKL
jgi:hypothetical protein